MSRRRNEREKGGSRPTSWSHQRDAFIPPPRDERSPSRRLSKTRLKHRRKPQDDLEHAVVERAAMPMPRAWQMLRARARPRPPWRLPSGPRPCARSGRRGARGRPPRKGRWRGCGRPAQPPSPFSPPSPAGSAAISTSEPGSRCSSALVTRLSSRRSKRVPLVTTVSGSSSSTTKLSLPARRRSTAASARRSSIRSRRGAEPGSSSRASARSCSATCSMRSALFSTSR